MNSVVWCAWQQWLPAFLMPMIHGRDDVTEFQRECDLAFMPNEVMQCKKHVDSLVITPMDKRSQHLLIW